jgi:hypothetical protein
MVPKGSCHGLSLPGGSAGLAALKYNSTERRVESFADDLNTRRGIVRGRVALLPRSSEIQPFVASIRPPPSQQNQPFSPERPGVWNVANVPFFFLSVGSKHLYYYNAS